MNSIFEKSAKQNVREIRKR